MSKSPKDQYSATESKQRLEAALRGARIAGHKTIDEIRKRPKRTTEKKAKAKPK